MENDYTTHALSIASEGDLIAWLATLDRSGAEQAQALQALAHLHRSRQLDAFEHLQAAAERKQPQPDHISWLQICRELIPLLDEDASRVASALAKLAETPWGTTLPDSFIDWCMRDQKRIDEVLALVHTRELPDFALTAALIAGLRKDPSTYLDPALTYASGTHNARQSGIRALGSMAHQDDRLTAKALRSRPINFLSRRGAV